MTSRVEDSGGKDVRGPRGSRRRRLIGGVLSLLVVALGCSWWFDPLRRIPDPGVPFDESELIGIVIPDNENAFVLYREAAARFTEQGNLPVGSTWSAASREVRQWLEANRVALDLYLKGSERPDAIYHRPESVRLDTLLDVSQKLRGIARVALLEASRRQDEGDLAGAWECHEAVLRSGRHSGRNGGLVERLVGEAMVRSATEPIARWAADPRVDSDLLRRALQDAEDADRLGVPLSRTLKYMYLMYAQTLRDPRLSSILTSMGIQGGPSTGIQLGPFRFDWAGLRQNGMRAWIRAEPERSIRLLRQIYWNQLAHCDLPAAERPPLAQGLEFALFDAGGGLRDEIRMDPTKIREELRSSYLDQMLGAPVDSSFKSRLEHDQAGESPDPTDHGRLVELLRAELARREGGKHGESGDRSP